MKKATKKRLREELARLNTTCERVHRLRMTKVDLSKDDDFDLGGVLVDLDRAACKIEEMLTREKYA